MNAEFMLDLLPVFMGYLNGAFFAALAFGVVRERRLAREVKALEEIRAILRSDPRDTYRD